MTAIGDVLRREIKALAFDQYGTIVDMQKGLTEAATPFLKAKGWDGKPNSFVTWWRRTHYENSMIDALCDRGHTPYRQIGHRAVSHVMDRCGFGCPLNFFLRDVSPNTVGDVLADRAAEQEGFLLHDPDLLSQISPRVIPKFHAVDQNTTASVFMEAGQQIHQR